MVLKADEWAQYMLLMQLSMLDTTDTTFSPYNQRIIANINQLHSCIDTLTGMLTFLDANTPGQ